MASTYVILFTVVLIKSLVKETNMNFQWSVGANSVVKVDAFDEEYWAQACNQFKEIDLSGGDPLGRTDRFIAKKIGGGRLVRDLFYIFHKREFEIKTDVRANLEIVKGLIEQSQTLPDFPTLRETTVGNKLEAAMAAKYYAQELTKRIPDVVLDMAKEVGEEQENLDEANEKLDVLYDTKLDDQQQIDPNDPELLEAIEVVNEAQENMTEVLERLEDSMNQNEGSIMVALSDGAQKTQCDLIETLTYVKAFTRAAGGSGYEIDLESLKWAKAAAQAMPALNHFADLLGWGQRTMRGLWRNSMRSATNPAGVKAKEFNPKKVLFKEKMSLMGAFGIARKIGAQIRFGNNALMHYHREGGQEQEGLGDVYFMIDVSGSMSDKEVQTLIAIMWAMLEICRKDNRRFVACQYAGWGQYSIWSAPVDGEPADPQGLAGMLSRKYTGGTEPYQPMAELLKQIIANEVKGDLVNFTDGHFAEIDAETMSLVKKARENGTRLFTVNSGYGTNANAEAYSDLCMTVVDLYQKKEALIDLMKSIV